MLWFTINCKNIWERLNLQKKKRIWQGDLASKKPSLLTKNFLKIKNFCLDES